MKGLSMTSSPRTSKASSNATSSPASGSGRSAPASPDGQTIDLFGQALAPAVPSASQGARKASRTRATYGRNGFASSSSAGLTSSLVNNLTRRSSGSILFKVTLKAVATPSGRLLFRLAVSADRTNASELASWPTPTTPSGGQSVPPGTTVTGRRPDGSKATVTLEMAAQFAAWPTPQEGDGRRGAAESHMDGRRSNLRDFATLAGWATPSWRDFRTPNLASFAERGGGQKGEQLSNQVIHSGPALIGSSAEIASGARLNPALARSLMRVPPEWCACAVMAMQSTSRRSRR